mmetsp:Transcript_167858/g.539145  ORF Transcript_167858/g.539145 Transcript_167858/m.539145 type:complete len:213 (-) Transcript_167858:13-651(-)
MGNPRRPLWQRWGACRRCMGQRRWRWRCLGSRRRQPTSFRWRRRRRCWWPLEPPKWRNRLGLHRRQPSGCPNGGPDGEASVTSVASDARGRDQQRGGLRDHQPHQPHGADAQPLAEGHLRWHVAGRAGDAPATPNWERLRGPVWDQPRQPPRQARRGGTDGRGFVKESARGARARMRMLATARALREVRAHSGCGSPPKAGGRAREAKACIS